MVGFVKTRALSLRGGTGDVRRSVLSDGRFVKTRALSLRGGTGDVRRSVLSDGRFCED